MHLWKYLHFVFIHWAITVPNIGFFTALGTLLWDIFTFPRHSWLELGTSDKNALGPIWGDGGSITEQKLCMKYSTAESGSEGDFIPSFLHQLQWVFTLSHIVIANCSLSWVQRKMYAISHLLKLFGEVFLSFLSLSLGWGVEGTWKADLQLSRQQSVGMMHIFSCYWCCFSVHQFTGTSFRLGTSGKNKSFPV